MKPSWTYLYYVEEQRSITFRPIETPEPYPQIELSYSRLEESKQNRLFFFFDGRDARAVPEYISIYIAEKQT
jgi:hypothetical protein